jgi:hypothetical protein
MTERVKGLQGKLKKGPSQDVMGEITGLEEGLGSSKQKIGN